MIDYAKNVCAMAVIFGGILIASKNVLPTEYILGARISYLNSVEFGYFDVGKLRWVHFAYSLCNLYNFRHQFTLMAPRQSPKAQVIEQYPANVCAAAPGTIKSVRAHLHDCHAGHATCPRPHSGYMPTKLSRYPGNMVLGYAGYTKQNRMSSLTPHCPTAGAVIKIARRPRRL